MQFIYGTGNPAKLAHMRRMLEGIDIQLRGLATLGMPVPDVPETGVTPLENATLKALAYYRAFQAPVFSCDSGLYIDGLEPARQPGVHVRNVGNRTLSDAEMCAHYAGIARSMGGRCIARYRNGVCAITAPNRVWQDMSEAISGAPFYLVDRPHPARREGYPLDSISVHIDSGAYFYDRAWTEDGDLAQGFRAFFRRVLAES